MSKSNIIKETALRLGFAAVGITTAEALDCEAYLDSAIREGRIAQMKWLSRNPEARCDPKSLLPQVKSVICCAWAYGNEGFSPSTHNTCKETRARRARYARGADYHEFILDKLTILWGEIKKEFPAAKSKFCVDTSPIMEKALAMRAGLGWVGKHTILVNKNIGSWFMLGEIITDIELNPDTPSKDGCGECAACINACPTGAIIAPQKLDSGRCISYFTTETKGCVPDGLRQFVSEGAFGCDICQEACPYNQAVYNRRFG